MIGEIDDFPEGNRVGFSVLNKDDDVPADVSLPGDISALVCSGCSLEMAVAVSVEKEGEAEVVDILTAAASFSGSVVLNTEDDVVVTVSWVDMSIV